MIKLHSIARQVTEASDMEEVFAVGISEGQGLSGDLNPASEIYVLSRESWVKACDETDTELSWLSRGAHLLIKGFEFLPTDVGRTLHIGEVVLEITREAGSCTHIQGQAPRLFEALQMGWRGGVSCRIIRGGNIQAGDDVNIAD